MVRPGTHPPGALGKVSTTYDDDTFHIQLAPTYLGTSLRNTPEVHVRTLRHVPTSGKRNYVIFPLKMRTASSSGHLFDFQEREMFLSTGTQVTVQLV